MSGSTKSLFRGAVLSGVLAVGIGASPAQSADVSLVLDWAFQGPQSTFLYGKEIGLFSAEGLNVTIDRGNGSGSTVLRVATGTYDFGWADLASMIKYNMKKPSKELQAVYVTGANSPLTIVTIKGRGITKPKDLEGKTLTSTAASSALALFKVFAAKTGIDASTVKWKQVSGKLREPLMVKGDSDALPGFTTSSILNVARLGIPMKDIIVMRYSDYGVKQYGTAIMVKRDYALKNGDTVRAMVRAVNNSFMAAIKNPKASVKTILGRDKLADIKLECRRLLEGMGNLTLSAEFKKNGISSVDDARIQEAIKELKGAYGISGDLKIPPYTAKFLPSKADRIPPALGSCA